MRPTYLKVGKYRTKTRAIQTVLPPTSTAGAPSQTDVTYNNENDSTASRTITATMPTNASGDRVYMLIVGYGSGYQVTSAPAGFSLVSSVVVNTVSYHYVYKLDVTSTTSTAGFDVAGGYWYWVALTVKNPGTEHVSSHSQALGNSINPPAITPSSGAGDYLVLTFNGAQTSDATPTTGSTGYTDVHQAGNTGFLAPWAYVQKRVVSITTSEDPASFTYPSSSTGAAYSSLTVALLGESATVAAASHTHDTGDVSDVATASALGQLLVSDGDSWETLTVGSNDQVLVADSGEALGVKWAAAGGVTDHGTLTGLTDDDHTQYVLADGTRAFTGEQSMGSNKLTNVTDPTADQDAATKAYVDNNAGSGELLMQDGVTAPPVPIENEAQDDWLYEG